MAAPTRRILTALSTAAMLLLAAVTVAPPAGAERGDWTKISTGTAASSYQSSLHRTPDGVLHVLYPKRSGDTTTYGHAAIDPDGSLVGQGDVLTPGWATLDPTPALIGNGDGLRAVFGGVRDAGPGFWSDGRMYTATAPEDGEGWTLPAEAVGQSHSAHASHGTAAVELADGTPVSAFARRSHIVWHVGTGAEPDQRVDVGSCCASSLSMVNDNGTVWIAWHQNGRTAATNGTFVKAILPSVGPTMKAPGSSRGARSVPTGRVPLIVQSIPEEDGGPRVWTAYCVGYPTCDHVGLWKVGESHSAARTVPRSSGAAHIALDSAPGWYGEVIWVAWDDGRSRVRAVRTGRGFSSVRTLELPRSAGPPHGLSLDGATGLADIVVNVGRAFWHAQVAPSLTLRARPRTWEHGTKRTVRFTALAAGSVIGAEVKVGSRTCTTIDGESRSCSITFPRTMKRGTLIAKATASGYSPGTVRLTIS